MVTQICKIKVNSANVFVLFLLFRLSTVLVASPLGGGKLII
jgi:hypothetical protein